MFSLKRIPGPPLSALVNCLWYWEGAPQTHSKERLLPNGEAAIIFNLRDDPIRLYNALNLQKFESYGLAVLSGARSNCFVIDAQQQDRVIGIEFLPGGAFPFLGMPLSEVENLSVSLEELWPRRTGQIRERLLAAPDPDTMLKTLERCLFEQLIRAPELHPAVGYALDCFRRAPHSAKVAGVIEHIGLSSRRFIELFRRQVGLTPKVFCRVGRFQYVLRTVYRKKDVDWAQVALACGYYDQPHFIHDFHVFSGLTPSAYLTSATAHLNHVPLT